MVRWIVGSILHGRPIGLFLVPASAPRLVGMMHIKEPLLLIEKSSPFGGSRGFPLSLSVVLYHMSEFTIMC